MGTEHPHGSLRKLDTSWWACHDDWSTPHLAPRCYTQNIFNMWGSGRGLMGVGGRKSQKIDFWKFVLHRSWVLSGVTGHLLRPLGVSRALLDHPEPLTGRTSPACPASLKRTGRGDEQNTRKSRKITKIDFFLDFGLVCFWALHGCPLQPPTPSRALPGLPGPSPASKKRTKF